MMLPTVSGLPPSLYSSLYAANAQRGAFVSFGKDLPPPFSKPPTSNRWMVWALSPVATLISGFWFRNQEIILEPSDLKQFKTLQKANQATIVALNHPSSASDPLIDFAYFKAKLFPSMALWAHVNWFKTPLRFILRRLNIIPNNTGQAGIEFAATEALKGHGVLMHPEGRSTFTGDRVQTLYPGMAKIAKEAVRQKHQSKEYATKAVCILPVVIKYRYDKDISRPLRRQINWLGLITGIKIDKKMPLEQAFWTLHAGILTSRWQRLVKAGVVKTPVPIGITATNYFMQKDRLLRELTQWLCQKYQVPDNQPTEEALRLVARAIRTTRVGKQPWHPDNIRLRLAKYLQAIQPSVYATPTLSQEQVAESLNRVRQYVLNKSGLYGPKHFGERTVYVKLLDQLLITNQSEAAITQTVKQRMQLGLDILTRSHPSKVSYRNPFL